MTKSNPKSFPFLWLSYLRKNAPKRGTLSLPSFPYRIARKHVSWRMIVIAGRKKTDLWRRKKNRHYYYLQEDFFSSQIKTASLPRWTSQTVKIDMTQWKHQRGMLKIRPSMTQLHTRLERNVAMWSLQNKCILIFNASFCPICCLWNKAFQYHNTPRGITAIGYCTRCARIVLRKAPWRRI